jgi:hypothetical protein
LVDSDDHFRLSRGVGTKQAVIDILGVSQKDNQVDSDIAVSDKLQPGGNYTSRAVVFSLNQAGNLDRVGSGADLTPDLAKFYLNRIIKGCPTEWAETLALNNFRLEPMMRAQTEYINPDGSYEGVIEYTVLLTNGRVVIEQRLPK